MTEVLTLREFAARMPGKDGEPMTVEAARKHIVKDHVPGAFRLGRDWYINWTHFLEATVTPAVASTPADPIKPPAGVRPLNTLSP